MVVSAGDETFAADFNDLEDKTSSRPICRLAQQTGQTGNATGTTLTLTFGTGSETVDTDGMHSESVNNTRITPVKPGWYRVVVQPILAFNANITGCHSAALKNGVVQQRSGNHRPNNTSINAGAMPLEVWMTANGTTDYFEAAVQAATSSGTWDTNAAAGSQSTFMVEFLRDL